MKRANRFFVGILFAVFSVAYAHSAAIGAGIPAAIYLPQSQNLILINFNQDEYKSAANVDQVLPFFQVLIQNTLNGFGIDVSNPIVLTPEQLAGVGDADAINSLLQQPGFLSSLNATVYILIDATTVPNPQDPNTVDYRLDAQLYLNLTPGNFTYLMGMEIPSYLPAVISQLAQ